MTDMLATIAPKSNQLNADDLLGGRTITVKITKVSGATGEQPIAINYDGDKGKPYYPCKSMRRVMVYVWGDKGQEYVGRSMTLYCDPTVKFGGLEVGGIRISHMSHLKKEIVMALTTSKSNKKPFTVKPLIEEVTMSAEDWVSDILAVPTMDGLKHKFTEAQKSMKDSPDFGKVVEAKEKRKLELSIPHPVPTSAPSPE